MACQHVTLPGGGHAIVCGTRGPPRCACGSGRSVTRLCDWKTESKSGTCDAKLCTKCTSSPAPDKDLCAKHAAAWAERKAAR